MANNNGRRKAYTRAEKNAFALGCRVGASKMKKSARRTSRPRYGY